MSKMTHRDMYKVWLSEEYKAHEIPSRNKYHMMEGEGRDGRPIFFFLGENGAIRTGITKNASKSTSWTGFINMEKLKNYLDNRGLLR